MKLFLINLDRAVDRRDYMLSELHRLLPDAQVERALCVDIKSDNWEPPSNVTPGKWSSDRWSLPPSDIEIFRSHMDCWQKIATTGEPGIVLEDDLLFSNDFKTVFDLLNSQRPSALIRLDGVHFPLILAPSDISVGSFGLSRVLSIAASAAAYYLDPVVAKNLLNAARIDRTVDDYLFDPDSAERGARGHNLPIYQLEPAVAVQAEWGAISDPGRDTPAFLKTTKRVDAPTRRDRSYVGPWPYRLRKELYRAIHKHRRKRRLERVEKSGGRWGAPELSPDLRWD